ncbi:MAG TPA: DUF4070 domain-containing protein, partial [Myxococcales bacterium]
GGPAPTTAPGHFDDADHLFQGEAEGRLAGLVAALEDPSRPAPRVLSPQGDARPTLEATPVPRFDLLEREAYASLSLQLSRGCPFQCEFCDIIEMFGRVPRLKSAEAILAELDALHALGARGSVFFVDDNFIGNRRAVARLLPRIEAWQEAHGWPFDLYTEASLDLAQEPALLEAMVEAGFTAVFVGIESPAPESLREAHKTQNLRLDPAEGVRILTRAGLEVFAGFILGFDADPPDVFERQIAFICESPIPRAMIGLLTALPGTALWRRLEREGRLRAAASGDQFERPNFETAMEDRTLLAGYRRVLAACYSDEAYYARCERHLSTVRLRPGGALPPGWLPALARAMVGIGLAGRRRLRFWRLLGLGLRRGVGGFARAVTLAILGEHMIRYTDEVVLPRLDAALAALPEPAAVVPAVTRATPASHPSLAPGAAAPA